MKIVIQCAGSKVSDAGMMKSNDGRNVQFVAAPSLAHDDSEIIYRRPDDMSDTGLPWRVELLRYNQRGDNPFNLLPAYRLYKPGVYQKLIERYGTKSVFILSAGWGLVGSDLLLPDYNITYSSSAPPWSRRKKTDRFDDFSFLPEGTEELLFLGGKSYQALFCRLTEGYPGKRIVFYNSGEQSDLPGCTCRLYQSRQKTNWHYSCAEALLGGDVSI